MCYHSSTQGVPPEDPGAFLATATGGKVLLPLTRSNLIYVGLGMRPVYGHG